jgi:hypothetical protein
MFVIRLEQVLASEAPQAQPLEAPRAPLGEAPASVNLKIVLHGHEVMVTLRDASEAVLLQRLEAFLGNKNITPLPKPAPRGSGQWKQRYQGR